MGQVSIGSYILASFGRSGSLAHRFQFHAEFLSYDRKIVRNPRIRYRRIGTKSHS